MSDKQHYSPQDLQALLHAKPGTPEELARAKKEIDLYFADLEAKRQAKEQAAASPGKKSLSTIENDTPRMAEMRNRQRFLGLAIRLTGLAIWIIVSISLVDRNAAMCLTACVGLSFTIWFASMRLQEQARAKAKALSRNTDVVRLSQTRHRSRLRMQGEDGDATSREKWLTLGKLIEEILHCETPEKALGPAEEGLALVKYLTGKTQKTQAKKQPGTVIDPLNMLIEKLIDEHELEFADKLSHHYLSLLTREN